MSGAEPRAPDQPGRQVVHVGVEYAGAPVAGDHMLIDIDVTKFDEPELERLALAAYDDVFRRTDCAPDGGSTDCRYVVDSPATSRHAA